MLSKEYLADVEKRIQDVRTADRWIKAPYLAAIPNGMEASTIPQKLAADTQFLLRETTMLGSRLHAAENEASLLTSSLDCAERSLHAAGFTLKEGAQEWRPPLGQSASPLLDTIDQLREQVASLQLLCGTKATEQGVRDLLESLKLKFSTPVDALLTNMGAAGNQRAFEVLESINHRGEQAVQALTVAYAQKAMRVKELEAELEAVGAGGVQSLRKVEKKLAESTQEPVMWQFRWTNPAANTDVTEADLAWSVVEPRSLFQSLDDRLAELKAFTYGDKPIYEVRALYAAAQPVNQQMLEALRKIVSMDDAERLTQGDIERGRAAIAQAEAQQAQQNPVCEPQDDDHDWPIETSEGDAREYTKGGAA